MPTKIGQTGLTFPDNTVQTTAAIAGAAGFGGFTNMQVFTSSGTFTVPTGKTAARVTVVGGGASGSISGYYFFGAEGNDIGWNAFACGGGGGTSIVIPSNLVPGTTIAVTVGLGGAARTSSSDVPTAGNAGGTSSFGTYCSATGGAANGTGGIGVGGTLNMRGGSGNASPAGYSNTYNPGGTGATGGSSSMGGESSGTGSIYGGGGAGVQSNTGGLNVTSGAGAAGVVFVEY